MSMSPKLGLLLLALAILVLGEHNPGARLLLRDPSRPSPFAGRRLFGGGAIDVHGCTNVSL